MWGIPQSILPVSFKRRARGCANHGSKRMYFVRCGPSYRESSTQPLTPATCNHTTQTPQTVDHGSPFVSLEHYSESIPYLKFSSSTQRVLEYLTEVASATT